MDVPAGWYPDPAAPPVPTARWWDGASWTDRTVPLDSLTPQPQDAGYAAPWADTVVVPVAPQPGEFVPPLGVTPPEGFPDTAVYPAGTAYDTAGFPAAPATAGRRAGWGVAALVGVIVVALAVAAVLVVKALGSGTGGASASSPSATAPSTPATPAPSSPGPSGPSASGGATSAEAAAAGKVLETFKPTTDRLGAGVAVTLIPQGDVAQGEKTLDGWCSSSYTTEKDRIARRQWALTQDGRSIGLSVEAVAYGTPEQAAAALAELTAKTRACTGVPLDEDGTTFTQDLVSSGAMSGLPSGISGYRGVTTLSGQAADGTPVTVTSTSTAQRKGRYLTIVWTNQPAAITAADQQVIDGFVAQQTAALDAAG